jgi:hypothetical protein
MTRSSRTPILPTDVNARVHAELQPGERLVWAGQPNPRAYARGAWVVSIFGVVFTAFAGLWILTAGGFAWFARDHAFGDDAPGPAKLFACFPLFGLLPLLAGIALLLAPVWMRRAARRDVYAITDRRVIMWQARPFGELIVRSFAPTELTQLTRVERADGTGDLVLLEVLNQVNSRGHHRMWSPTRLGFVGVNNVREVEDLLRKSLPVPV